MKCYWLKLLLLATFAYWATGVAKHVHEAMEHHGRDASVDDDDDDDNSASAALPSGKAPTTPEHAPVPVKRPCPVCQMLAAMTVDRSTPPVIPSLGTQLIATLILCDHIAPVLHACFALWARGPPSTASSR